MDQHPHTAVDESDPVPADELSLPEHRDHTLAGDCWCDPVVERVAPIRDAGGLRNWQRTRS